MTALRFPTTKIVPEMDPTERLIHDLHQIARDFEGAIDAAPTVHQACQIRERVSACVQMLTAVEDRALTKTRAF